MSLGPRENSRGSLPAVSGAMSPAAERQLQMSKNMIDPKTATPKGGHSYGPFFTEYCLMAEYDLLNQQKLPGMYVLPSSLTPLIWHGVIFVRQGIYQGAVFRFQLFIPEQFPDAECPSVVFDPPIFHPLVDPDQGNLDVKRVFPKWKRHVHHVWQVLLYIRRLFSKIDTKNPLNEEAARLYESDLEFFSYKVADCIRICKDGLYDPSKSEDGHILKFDKWDPFEHEDVKKKMLSKVLTDNTGVAKKDYSAISWMSPDSLHTFTNRA